MMDADSALARLQRLMAENGQTDSELKGRWTDPPAEKWPFSGVLESRRIGASRCPSVPRGCASVDSTPKKFQIFFLARLGWFSATDVILDFGNCS